LLMLPAIADLLFPSHYSMVRHPPGGPNLMFSLCSICRLAPEVKRR
jgi:hypothetical protein